MKKILLFLLIIIGFVSTALAQTDDQAPKFGAGLTFGGTTGSASGYYPVAGGFSLRFELPLSAPVNVVLATGYTYFVSSNGYGVDYEFDTGDGGDNYSYGSLASFIPLQAGLKFFPIGRFFLEGDAGVSLKLSDNADEYPGKKVAPLISPSAGYSIAIGSSNRYSVDLSLGYDARLEPGGGYSQVAFKAVFNIGLSR